MTRRTAGWEGLDYRDLSGEMVGGVQEETDGTWTGNCLEEWQEGFETQEQAQSWVEEMSGNVFSSATKTTHSDYEWSQTSLETFSYLPERVTDVSHQGRILPSSDGYGWSGVVVDGHNTHQASSDFGTFREAQDFVESYFATRRTAGDYTKSVIEKEPGEWYWEVLSPEGDLLDAGTQVSEDMACEAAENCINHELGQEESYESSTHSSGDIDYYISRCVGVLKDYAGEERDPQPTGRVIDTGNGDPWLEFSIEGTSIWACPTGWAFTAPKGGEELTLDSLSTKYSQLESYEASSREYSVTEKGDGGYVVSDQYGDVVAWVKSDGTYTFREGGEDKAEDGWDGLLAVRDVLDSEGIELPLDHLTPRLSRTRSY